jgi:hypothetical protein
MSSLFAVLLGLHHGTLTRSKCYVEYLLLKFHFTLVHLFSSAIDEELSGLSTYFFKVTFTEELSGLNTYFFKVTLTKKCGLNTYFFKVTLMEELSGLNMYFSRSC